MKGTENDLRKRVRGVDDVLHVVAPEGPRGPRSQDEHGDLHGTGLPWHSVLRLRIHGSGS